MAEAWTTVVHRESEWTPQARAEALAAVQVDAQKCPECGHVGTLVEVSRTLPGGKRTKKPLAWHWPPRRRGKSAADERTFEIRRVRCITCAARAVVERDFNAALPDKDPPEGEMGPGDGLSFSIIRHYPEPSSQ